MAGLDCGVRLAIPSRVVCLVERDSYAAAVLLARMEDEALDPCPLWCGDLEDFNGRPWLGSVDLLVGSPPCQPVSVSGKRKGLADDRWLWPEFSRIIREVDPPLVFLENVPGLVSLGLREIARDLRELGYRLAGGLFSAAEVGAPHRRQRIFLLAHTNSHRSHGLHEWVQQGHMETNTAECSVGPSSSSSPGSTTLAHRDSTWERQFPRVFVDGRDRPRDSREASDLALPESQRRGQGEPEPARLAGGSDADSRRGELADPNNAPGGASDSKRGEGETRNSRKPPDAGLALWGSFWPPGPNETERWAELLAVRPDLAPALPKPPLRRDPSELPSGLDGAMSARVERLRCLGNSVVPRQAEWAFRTLWRDLFGDGSPIL